MRHVRKRSRKDGHVGRIIRGEVYAPEATTPTRDLIASEKSMLYDRWQVFGSVLQDLKVVRKAWPEGGEEDG